MDQRELGKTGILTAPIMFGGNVFGWTIDQEKSFELLDAFVEAGFNSIDTANCYSIWVDGNEGGESESIIGAWMKARGNRQDIILATKVGHDMRKRGRGLSKTHITKEVEASLQRLQTDYIDLYQAHRDDPNAPLEDVLETFDELIKAGKVRAIGASNYDATRLGEALEIAENNNLPHYRTLQPHYNLYKREKFEGEMQTLCRSRNIGVIPYFPLASGFLTGKYRSESDFSKSTRGGSMGKYLNERGLKILAALDTVANAYGTTPAAVALSWVMHQPSIIAPIASATDVSQLKDFSVATRLDLGDYALALLEEASKA
jgi:aryl-alcohol dehydrogenase-like predicted oxidoreductase